MMVTSPFPQVHFKIIFFYPRLLIIRRRYFIQHRLIMHSLSDLTHFINSCSFLILFNPRVLIPTKFSPNFKIFTQKGRDPRDLASVTCSNIWVFYPLFSVYAASLPCKYLRWDSYCLVLTFHDAVDSLL